MSNPIIIGLITSISFGFMISDAYAYLDAGTLGVVFQVIIGILVGIGITIKLYWAKLKYILSNKISNKSSD